MILSNGKIMTEGSNSMEKSKLIEMIKNNANAIAYINNPTDEIKLLAIKKNGLTLKYHWRCIKFSASCQ